jgi:hypothetical protein
MTSDDFAQALAALVPAPADYPGTTDMEEYAALQAEFTLIRLVQPRALPVVTHTELDELFARYEIVGMSACGITFFDVPFETEHGVTVAGEQETTFTVVPNGTIYLHTEQKTTPCAQSVSGFYQALLVFAQYYQQRRLGQVERRDQAARVAYARRAATAAGESAATSHYLDLLNSAFF